MNAVSLLIDKLESIWTTSKRVFGGNQSRVAWHTSGAGAAAHGIQIEAVMKVPMDRPLGSSM